MEDNNKNNMVMFPKLKIRYPFEVTELGDLTVAVGVEEGADAFHGMIKLENDSAVFMFKKLQEGITLPLLISACLEEYPGSTVEEVGPKVIEFLDTLKNNKLLMSNAKEGIYVDMSKYRKNNTDAE